jgi:NAD(P)-dependent dehydrogenase (short-subunit alcohol dehydrogenase family)
MAKIPSGSVSSRAAVIGSSGGIGRALCVALAAHGVGVRALSRSPDAGAGDDEQPIDITSEKSIDLAADRLRAEAPFNLIFLATGLLHDEHIRPEKALREIDQQSLMRHFAVNSVGPAVVAKHFVSLLPRDGRCVFAALSARVGSISDNRLGGWYGYRVSKAALNMTIKTIAIELARTHPEAICVGLHPGTVDTSLSKPFQRGAPARQLFSPDQAATNLLDVVELLTPTQSGRCFAWNGAEIAP